MDANEFLMNASALMEGEHDDIANLANMSALINQYLDRINWAGFYLYKEGQLILGPFQGKPACLRIPLDKGVCGKAAATREVQRIADVHCFEGHIACDAASRSEIVIPLIINDALYGVLDIDSPYIDRFSDNDEDVLKQFCDILVRHLSKSKA